MTSEEIQPDGSIALYLVNGSVIRYRFKNIYTHGLRQTHVRREGVVVGDGPLEYYIKHNNGEVTAYPWATVMKTHLVPNSEEYSNQERARRNEQTS